MRTPYLLIACSGTKVESPGLLRAIDRYDGPSYRVLRAGLQKALGGRLRLRILSAEFGLLSPFDPIPDYDRRLDADRAAQFANDRRIERTIREDIASVRPNSVFVMGGALYKEVFKGALEQAYIPSHASVSYSHGGIGEQLGQLKRWLEDGELKS